MVMYWYRCVSGIYDPTVKCERLGDVSAHFCVICPYRGKECKNPLWFPEIKKSEDSKKEVLKRIVDEISKEM